MGLARIASCSATVCVRCVALEVQVLLPMPGVSAASAAAEILDQLMAKAEECRAAALEYAMAPFRTRAQKGEDSGKPDSLQERWDEVWAADADVAVHRHRKSRAARPISWAEKAGGIALLITGKLLAPADAQERPPFLQLPEPDCEMDKATAIMQDTNTACDAGFAANQCDAPCALQMATLVDGDCAKTITGIVDQQDRVPNGLAERIDAQWARCVRVPAPELAALLGEVSCSRGGGHRRLQGASAEDLLRAYAAGDGSVCALLVAAPAPADGAAVSELPRARSVCVGCSI